MVVASALPEGGAMRAVMRMTFALAGLLVVSALPAMADDFEVQIDCGGSFAPGDAVPLDTRVENKTQNTVDVDAKIEIQVPGLGRILFKEVSLTLGPDQRREAD